MTTFLPLIHPNPADFGLLGSASIGLGSVVGAVRLALAANGVAVGAGTAAGAAAAALTALGTGQGVGGAAGAIQAVLSKAGIAAGVGAANAAVTALLSLTGAASGVGAVSGATLDVLSKAGTAAGLGAAAAAAIDTFLASGTAAGLGSATPAAPLWVPPQFAAAALYINWKQPAPDGTFGMAWLGASKVAKAANLIVSRTGTGGTALDPFGNVVSFTGTALRATNAGLTTEEARTNLVRNGGNTGAVIGAPGTLPTNWSVFSASGLSTSVIATGTANGVPYTDVRIFGTSNNTFFVLAFDGTNEATTTVGQVYTESLYAALVGGSLANISSVQTNLRQNGGAGPAASTSMSLSATLTRQPSASLTTVTGVTSISPALIINMSNASAIDITLRLGGVQNALGAFATTPILTSGAAVTRAQDFITFSDVSWLGQGQGSLYAAHTDEGASGTPRVFGVYDGTISNGVEMFAQAANSAIQVQLAGATQFQISGSAPVIGSLSRVAGAFSAAGGAFAVNSVGNATTGTFTMPTLSSAVLGNRPDSSRPMSGVITEMAYFPTALSNAQLQAITSPPSWVPAVFANADLYINWAQPVGDGTYGMAWLGPTKTAKAASLLVSRTGTGGTVLDASGNVVSVTGTALRANSAGLVTEEPRTNQVRNNTMVGAAFDNTNLLTTAGWIMSINGGTGTATNSPAGTLNLTGDGTNAATADQSFTTVVGRIYTVNATLAGTLAISVGTTQGGSTILSTSLSGSGTPLTSFQFTATGTTTWIRFARLAATIANVSAISLQWAGTSPTNWSAPSTLSGITTTIVGTGTINGVNYIDYAFAGTATAGVSYAQNFEAINAIAAANGQTWTAGAFLSVPSGSLGTSTVTLQVTGTNGASGIESGPVTANALTATMQRFPGTLTLANASSTFVRSRVLVSIANAAAVNFTLRIGLPTLELGAFATTPILTSGSAVTRAQDFISFSDVSWLVQGPGTIYGAQSTESVPAATNVVFSLDDGTFNNDVIVMVSSVAQQAPLLRLAGVAQTVPSGGVIVAANTPYKQAFAFAPNDLGFGYGGSVSARVTSATIPSVTAVHVGMAGDGSRVASAMITELAYFAAPLTNAQLQAITT